MSKTALFELALFDPENTLVSLLEKRNITFEKVLAARKFAAAMDETVMVFNNDSSESMVESLVSIFVEWLEAKQHRKIQAQLIDGSILYVHEYSVEEIAKILNSSLKITAFDPEYNNLILNNRPDHS